MNNLNTMTDHELVVLYEQGKDQAFDAKKPLPVQSWLSEVTAIRPQANLMLG